MKKQDYWFNDSQVDDYTSYFNENGFCVITNILEDKEISNALQEIWTHPALLGNSNIVENNPETWNIDIDNIGFLDLNGGYSHTELKYYWKTCFNEKIIKIYQTLYNDNIKFKNDRYGFMRPTKNIQMTDGSLIDKPEWKTKKKWLHVDMNPWKIQDYLRIQGLLTFTDQTETSGGFCCIPRFHKKIVDWSKNNTPNDREIISDIFYFDKDSKEQNNIINLIVPKGSLILWDRRIPHCNYPNDDNTFRIVQYLHYELEEHITNTITQTHIKLGLEHKLLPKDSYFPNKLTEKQLELIDYNKYKDIITTERELEGYKKYKRACALETDGKYIEATKLYSLAFKMCPILEKI